MYNLEKVLSLKYNFTYKGVTMKLIFSLLLLLSTLSFANRIEDLAFDAYKAKDYKTALKLYQQEAKKESLKSLFMIAIFLEKGLAIPQDKQKAIKIYKLILKKSINTKMNAKSLDIATLAAKRLYILTKQKEFITLSSKLQKLKKELIAKSLQNANKKIAHYLKSCPAARAIPKEYQDGIEKIDCTLFKEFPDRMLTFMQLKSKRELAILAHNESELYEINKKLIKTIKPVLKFIEQKTIECYSNANFLSDVKMCDYNYFVQTDPLLFTQKAKEIKKLLADSKKNESKLDNYQKDKLINSLIYQFSTKDYEKDAYRMVQLN